MKKQQFDSFYYYLCDVASLYKSTGSLRNFSALAKKYKCTKITIAQFYEYGLHELSDSPSRQLSDKIRNDISELERKRKLGNPRFTKGQIIAWKNNDGSEAIASVATDATRFSYCYNFKGNKCMVIFDSIPDDVEIITPSHETLVKFCEELVRQAESSNKYLF